MGGLVARYALREMEMLPGQNHDTRKFISFDSPQQGANVPLGSQWMIMDLVTTQIAGVQLSSFMPELQDGIDILKSPAAQQTLIYSVLPQAGAKYNSLFGWFSTNGYPNCELVSVSSGSQVGQGQSFGPHATLLEIKSGNTLIVPLFHIPGVLINNNPVPLPSSIGKVIWCFGTGITCRFKIQALPDNPTDFEDIYLGRLFASVLGIPVDYCKKTISVKNCKPFDSAPGGIYDIEQFVVLDELLDDLPAEIDPIITGFDFIPSVSSVDLRPANSYNLYVDISNLGIFPDKTPFTSYTAPNVLSGGDEDPNDFHIDFSENNVADFKKYLIDYNHSYDDLPGFPDISNVSYNFGKNSTQRTTERVFENVNINSNAIFSVNKNSGIGLDYEGLNPPTPGSNFNLYIGGLDCHPSGTIITIGNGGTLELGDSPVGNQACVYFHRGSTLIIRSGGKLIINNNSRLIIEEGAKLVYEPGAEIQLLGDNAVLELTGTLELKPGADFTFTYPGHNSGYVLFNAPGYPSDNITAPWGGNPTVSLIGASKLDKVAEITQESLYLKENIGLFKVLHGQIAMGDDARLNIACPIRMLGAAITTNAVGIEHRGLKVFGQPATIAGCSFYGGKYGIDAELFCNGHPLTVTNCDFENCLEGISSHGAGMKLINCTFTDCRDYGWNYNQSDMPNLVSGCTFDVENEDVTAVGISGQLLNNNELKISNTTIMHQQVGVWNGNGSLILKCNSISGNSIYGIEVHSDAFIVASSSILPGCGYNEIVNNGLGDQFGANIYFEKAKRPFFDYGFNSFYRGTWRDHGQNVAVVFYVDLDEDCNLGPEISAQNNRWFYLDPEKLPVPAQFIPPSPALVTPICNWDYTFTDQNPQSAACPTTPVVFPPDGSILTRCNDCYIFPSGALAGLKYNEAVLAAIQKTEMFDSTANNIEALDLFYEILLAPVDSSNDDYLQLATLALKQMGITLSDAFAKGEITLLENQTTLHPAVENYFEILRRFSTPSTQDNYQSQFWLDVAKAELMQLAGRRDIGLNILDTIGNCFIGKDEVTFLENKKIYVSAEDKVISGEVSIEKFDSLLAGITPRENPISNVDTTVQIGNNTHLGSGITIGSNVHIGNNVIIEDGVVIGDNAQIKNNAHLKKDANIGASAVISNNAIIDEKAIVEANSIVGNNSKVGKKALVGGGCIIGNNVEIGGLVNIAAGVNIANDVEVADGTHISESVLLANNVKIGMNVLIGESSSLKNNVKVGDYTQIGKNVIANNNVKIGSAVVIADNSIIKTNISVCDEQQAAGNINKKVGNCSSPSLPSTPATTPYNCTFVQQYATLFDNLFNGFTAKSSTGNTAFFVDENITFSPEEVALNYSWELGDCSISTDKSPVHKFSAPGTYLITLTRTLNCVDYTTIGAITVLPRPELEQTITLGNVCSLPVSASIMVQADAIDSASTQCQNIIGCASYSKTDTARYRIIFDMFLGDNKVLDQDTVLLSFASSTTAIPNIIIPIDAAGDYEIFTSSFIERYNLLSKQWEQISDTLFDKDTIHVLQEPHAGILVPDIVYLGDSTEFQSNSSGGSTQFSYHWLVNNSVYLDGQDITAVFYSETAEIQHWIIDQTTGCTDTAYAEVIVTGLQVEYSYLPTICYPGVINIVPQITGGVPPFSYEWQVEMGGSIQTVSTDAEISGEAPQPGVYPLFLIVTDSIGNSDTAFHVVTSIAAMQPSMTSPSLLCEGVPAIFENTSTFAGDFSWTVNGEDAGQTTNLEHTFYGIGDYEVILNSTDANGCSGSAQAIVSVGNCYFLSGTVMTDPACGGSLTAGATIILADENYIPISGIDPAISDMYGNFSFTILPEQGMDSNTVCTFISDNGVVYEGYTPAPLYQLSAHSLQLVSYNVNLEWYSMLSDVDSLSAIGTAIDIADNIYVLGNIQRVSTRGDIALVKYDAYGSLLWTRVFDLDNNWDYPWGYYLDSSGNSYIAGYTNSPSDMLIIKYDSAGNRLWYRTFGGTSNDNDDARGIFADADGKVYVCGTASNLSSQNDIMTLCYDSAGQLLWQQAYISPSSKTSENAVAIDHDANGNIIVFGHGEGNAFIVVKYDHDGNMIWDHYQILAQSLFPTAMEVDNSSDIIVTGYYSDQLSYQTAKLSGANGSIIWSAQYPATNAIPRAIAVDNDNNVFVTGRAENNLTVVKYHPDGTTAWFTAYEAPELSQGISIATDDEGNAYVTGYFSIPATDIFTLKYAADGRLLWAERFNAGYPGKASGNDLVVSENGNVYVTGYCKYDIATVATTLKYSQCGEGIGVLSTQPSISPVMIQEMQQDSSTVSSIGEYLTIIPNPYIGRTTILCNTENDFDAKIQVYDMSGKLINVLHDGQLTKGKHAFLFSAAEKGYSPGIYVLVFSHSNGMQVKYLIEQ